MDVTTRAERRSHSTKNEAVCHVRGWWVLDHEYTLVHLYTLKIQDTRYKNDTDMDEPVKPVVASWAVLSGPSRESPGRRSEAVRDGESN
jgi:hypothetical protein